MPKSRDNSSFKGFLDQETPFLASIKSIVAAIILAVSFEAGARTLIPDGTWAKIIVPIMSATGLLGVCIYIGFAKRERTSEIALPLESPSAFEYRYHQTVRRYCKAGAIATIDPSSLSTLRFPLKQAASD